jgi:uncharacterized protein DUF4345
MEVEPVSNTSRRALQIVSAVLGVVPVVTGLIGLRGVNDPLYAPVNSPHVVLLDTNLRFFSGLWLGLGLALLWLIPSIERQTVPFRMIWGAIFVGGIGRVLSIVLAGTPPAPFVFFTLLEILGAPLFIYWQHRVAQMALSASRQRG